MRRALAAQRDVLPHQAGELAEPRPTESAECPDDVALDALHRLGQVARLRQAVYDAESPLLFSPLLADPRAQELRDQAAGQIADALATLERLRGRLSVERRELLLGQTETTGEWLSRQAAPTGRHSVWGRG